MISRLLFKELMRPNFSSALPESFGNTKVVVLCGNRATLILSRRISHGSNLSLFDLSFLGPVQTPYLSCAVQNTFSLRGRIKRHALPYHEILPCPTEICGKKTDLVTVPLPNNYSLLGTAHERYGV